MNAAAVTGPSKKIRRSTGVYLQERKVRPGSTSEKVKPGIKRRRGGLVRKEKGNFLERGGKSFAP